MRTIMVMGLLISLFHITDLSAVEPGPVDLQVMREAGLSQETMGRFLAQNLMAGRQAPPLEPDFLVSLARYGGEGLAVAYLDLDKVSAQKLSREFSPEVVAQLMANGTAPEELSRLLTGEVALATAPSQPIVAPTRPQALVEPPLPPAAPAVALEVAPVTPPPAALAPVPPAAAPPVAPPPAKAFQDLRPGQAADPASRLPLPYSTYDIRQNRQDGQVRGRQNSDEPWMGVREKELPDGHLVEVNSLGRMDQVGQEVYTRPSGHQVYRYYTGNPDQPKSGEDLRQQQRNREDLQIIFNRNRD